jgi:hypothetical protein
MEPMYELTRPRTLARRTTLALLTALAVTLGAVAAPLAPAAHAGSKPSVILGAAVGFDAARGTPEIGRGGPGPSSRPDDGPGTIDAAGSKPGVGGQK